VTPKCLGPIVSHDLRSLDKSIQMTLCICVSGALQLKRICCRKYECTRETLLKFKEQLARKEQATTAVAVAVAGAPQSQQFVPSFGSFIPAAAPAAVATEVSIVRSILDLTNQRYESVLDLTNQRYEIYT